ncbi:MAG TPA: DUF2142 domain-containing protein, partial [Ilumatobacteraceae bacterium]|nr:DUF2142 domain-containing protein [Ilumatobacteraceae bacterium]
MARRDAARVTALFGLLWLVIASWSLATARYGGPDEPAHVLRAASVARGDVVGDPIDWLPPGYRMVTVAAGLTTGDPTCYRHNAALPATCAHADPAATGLGEAGSSAGTYPPYSYALVGLPARLVGGGGSVLAHRVIAAAWCAAILAVAFWRARRIAGPLLITAVMPAAWFL